MLAFRTPFEAFQHAVAAAWAFRCAQCVKVGLRPPAGLDLDAMRVAVTLAVGRKGSALVSFALGGFSALPRLSAIHPFNSALLHFKLKATHNYRSCTDKPQRT